MRREPPITFRGALQVLGVYERPLIDRLDRLLGGVILTAGALATAPAMAFLAPVWGLVDQKTEAVGLLRTCLDKALSRLSKVHGYERVELLAAAHTMIVISAFFDALRDKFSPADFQALGITGPEREMLAVGRWRTENESLLSLLWAVEVPMPGGAVGFGENVLDTTDWADRMAARVLAFIEGLNGGAELIHRRLNTDATAKTASR